MALPLTTAHGSGLRRQGISLTAAAGAGGVGEARQEPMLGFAAPRQRTTQAANTLRRPAQRMPRGSLPCRKAGAAGVQAAVIRTQTAPLDEAFFRVLEQRARPFDGYARGGTLQYHAAHCYAPARLRRCADARCGPVAETLS